METISQRAPASWSWKWTWRAVSGACGGTLTAAAARMAMSAISHSTRFSASRPTRSPGATPASIRAAAAASDLGPVVVPAQVAVEAVALEAQGGARPEALGLAAVQLGEVAVGHATVSGRPGRAAGASRLM